MLLRDDWSPPRVDLNILSDRGGLGDSLARLPALKYLHDINPHVYSTVYIQDAWLDLVKYLLPETERRTYRKLSEAHFHMKQPYVNFDMERLTTLQLHLTDHAFLILMDQLPPSAAHRSYWEAPFYIGAGLNYRLKDAGLAAKPYIVVTTDYTAPSRQWPAAHINTLAKTVSEAGLTPVLLGSIDPLYVGVVDDPVKPISANGLKKELYYDLRGLTSLKEALGIIQRAKAVVGIDNGLIHLAHYTTTPVVVGYTTLSPQHRLPVREAGVTKVIEAEVPCKGCQSRGFAINNDWRTCIFDDYACTLTLTAERFALALRELGVLP